MLATTYTPPVFEAPLVDYDAQPEPTIDPVVEVVDIADPLADTETEEKPERPYLLLAILGGILLAGGGVMYVSARKEERRRYGR
jgi:hypothetical protein